jgi:hypothetical protein
MADGEWVESRGTMSRGTYYTVLGISETATQDEINRAFKNVSEAYYVLSDPTQRVCYDQQLTQHRLFALPRNVRNLPLTGEPVFEWWVNWPFLSTVVLLIALWYEILS